MHSLSCSACPIETVVVYTQGALVTRSIPYVPTDCGTHTLCIEHLRQSCDPSSIRVVGSTQSCHIKEVKLCEGQFIRDDVQSKLSMSSKEKAAAEVIAALTSSWEQYQRVVTEKKACSEMIQLLHSYTNSRLTGGGSTREDTRSPVPPAEVVENLEWHKTQRQVLTDKEAELKGSLEALHRSVRYYLSKLPPSPASNGSKVLSIETTDKDLDHEIRRRVDHFLAVKTVSVHVTLDVVSTEVPLDLKLVYQPHRNLVGWQPAYDIRPTTPNTVTVTFSASIAQQSEEDWLNVKLSLSTVDIDEAKAGHVPELPIEGVGYQEDVAPILAGAPRTLRAARLPFVETCAFAMPSPAVTRVDDTGASVAYILPGCVTVETNNTVSSKMTITSLDLPCAWIRFVAPSLQPRVVFLCRIENTSDYHLLESTNVSLYTGTGVFIGYRSVSKRLAPGKAFVLSFGDDTSVDVKYIPTKLLEHGSWMSGNQRTRTYQATIYVRSASRANLEQVFPGVADVVVVGLAYPSSTDSKIVVKLQQPESFEERADPDDMKLIVNEQLRLSSEGFDSYDVVNKRNNHLFHFLSLTGEQDATIRFVYTIMWSGDKEVQIHQTFP